MARSKETREGAFSRSSTPWPDPEPARPKVTRDDVVRTALDVLDHDGLDGLTMRRLAERMGIKASSLYNHVRNKDNLLALIADVICGQVSDIDQASAWRDQLYALASQFRKALVAHRDGARVLAATPPFGPNRLRIIEQVLKILVSAGFSTVEAADVASVHNSYVVGFVLDETLGGANDKASLRRTREAGRRWFKSLSRDQYPTLVAWPINSSAHRRTGASLSAYKRCSMASRPGYPENETDSIPFRDLCALGTVAGSRATRRMLGCARAAFLGAKY